MLSALCALPAGMPEPLRHFLSQAVRWGHREEPSPPPAVLGEVWRDQPVHALLSGGHAQQAMQVPADLPSRCHVKLRDTKKTARVFRHR